MWVITPLNQVLWQFYTNNDCMKVSHNKLHTSKNCLRVQTIIIYKTAKWDLFIYGTYKGRQSSVKRFMWLFSLALSLSQVSTLLFYSRRTFLCVSLVSYIFVWLVWNRYFLSSRERILSNCSTKYRRRRWIDCERKKNLLFFGFS